jgi:TolA-binding protein
MNEEPRRWLDGGTDDARLRAFMQAGSEELAPAEVLARGVVASPRVQAQAAARAALEPGAPASSALKWLAALAVLALVTYVVLVLLARGSARFDRSEARPRSSVGAPQQQLSVQRPATSSPAARSRVSNEQTPIVAPAARPARGDVASSRSAALQTKRQEPAAQQRSPRTRVSALKTGEQPTQREPQAKAPEALAPSAASAQPAALEGAVHAAQAETSRAAPPSDAVGRPDIRGNQVQPALGTEQEELRQLEAAQRALNEDPARALALMQRHTKAYPRSWLAEERDALLFRTYLALRDAAHAHAALAQFKQRYPESPQLRQLERALHESDGAR